MTTGTDLGFAAALVRMTHFVQRVFGEVSREHALTPQQAQLLCQLVAGPVGMKDLGHRLNLEKSSLTGLVDRVEKRGLVERVDDPGDRRACRIQLTGEGASLGVKVHDLITARLEELAGDVTAGDRKRLAATISRLLAVQG
ncbi:MarR family winged helix-turn-helix transcriptional regulator [Amycolatopsis sp.]|uniref:MarR family winged helix-turn-helix transcriptional regulator n=1 Tax=Amycolatopsis sp. TaxID=37632 RepID=UPI002BF5DE1C|nr:MarR family transcriptional regulator [Amycolatopsis sp.]HVV09810.1 MarR family transcriptional regulator [Amycolatopsis sp.]